MAGLGESMTGKKHMDAADRQRKALEARKAGATYDQIARQLDYASTASAYKAVKVALRKTLQEPADELRTLELTRLDALLIPVWSQAMKGSLPAIDRAIRIMERRAKLLGLDAPLKFDLAQIVEQVAAELGLTDDETAETMTDVMAMLAVSKVPS
jgi:transposase-like protein